MKTLEPKHVVHEIAKTTHTDEETVSRTSSEAPDSYPQRARIYDDVALFAARRIR
jgi:Protein of unknown function (DUF3562)